MFLVLVIFYGRFKDGNDCEYHKCLQEDQHCAGEVYLVEESSSEAGA